MSDFIVPLEKLIEQFRKLPGIGHKTAVRLAFCVLDFSPEEAKSFADAIIDAKEKIHNCEICQNISDTPVCAICADDKRDKSVICVVEDPKSVMAIEKTREYNGVYHVLGGTVSPMNGVGVEQLKIRELVQRVAENEIKEIIIATNPSLEGETTAAYISKLLKAFDIPVSRLALGIPVGGELDYADEITILRAIEGRRRMN